jgi:hypothetical protein
MKKIELNQMEKIQGGGDFWEFLAGACAVYTGSIALKILSNLHPVAKGAQYGCIAYMVGYGVTR